MNTHFLFYWCWEYNRKLIKLDQHQSFYNLHLYFCYCFHKITLLFMLSFLHFPELISFLISGFGISRVLVKFRSIFCKVIRLWIRDLKDLSFICYSILTYLIKYSLMSLNLSNIIFLHWKIMALGHAISQTAYWLSNHALY